MPSTPLSTKELPLALLAAVAHPDEPFRADVAARLAEAIERRRPPHPHRTLRAFFIRQNKRRRANLQLPAPLRELGAFVARIAFSGGATDGRQRLLIAPGDGRARGYVVSRDLSVSTLGHAALTRHRARKQVEDCGFLPDLARKRLARFREPAVRARCRVSDRLLLELTEDSPWQPPVVCVSDGPRSPTLEQQGFAQERDGNTLRLWPATPEATVRFSAWLAEGRVLTLRHGYPSSHEYRTIAVRLRDFDGDAVDLRCLVAGNPSEPWLTRMPPLEMNLTDDDRAGIAGWAHPLNEWLTDRLAQRLI